jgi:hypothetical protein
MHPVELLGVMGGVESRFGPFEDVVSVVQDRWMVNAKCTIGSKIILDAPEVLLGYDAQPEACFSLFGDSANPDAK